jgi:hypothetical protein
MYVVKKSPGGSWMMMNEMTAIAISVGTIIKMRRPMNPSTLPPLYAL